MDIAVSPRADPQPCPHFFIVFEMTSRSNFVPPSVMKCVNLNKAGMEGLDAETINRIIFENSKGSKFFENEIRRGAILKKQIEQKLVKMESLTPEDIQTGEREADKVLEGYRSSRDLSNCIVHVDMDAFYAAVEMRDDPSLRLKPLAVGSSSMLSTSNYIARRYGVRAAMPGFLGRKLCPQLVIVPPDFGKYAAVSQKVREILAEYCLGGSAGMVTMSLDEAYLNITQHVTERVTYPPERRTFWPRMAPKMPALICRCRKSEVQTSESDAETNQSLPDETGGSEEDSQGALVPRAVGKDADLAVCLYCGLLLQPGQRVFGTTVTEAVREMRFRVFCATQLTCSAGIAPNSLLAKIASDWNKPNGQHLVEPTVAAVESFISNLPIRKVPGIGHVTECRLQAFGVHTIRDLFTRRGVLYHLVSPTSLRYFMRIVLGHSEDDWVTGAKREGNGDASTPSAAQKSMSIERTFADCYDPGALLKRCKELCASLAAEMKEEHVQGKTVTLKLKLDTFEVRTRSQTLPDFTCSPTAIFQCAQDILKEEMRIEAERSKSLTLRLMGVRMSNLMPSEMCQNYRQATLQSAFKQGFKGQESDRSSEAVTSPPQPPQRQANAHLEMVPGGVSEEPVAGPSTPATDQTDPQGSFIATCPVCARCLRLRSSDEINSHLDSCLSRDTVLEVVRESLQSSTPSSVASSSARTPETGQKRHPDGGVGKCVHRGPLDKYFRPG
ncbi:hypothetical protein AAHC03_0119 [Spirometra sp. Aus1]